MQDTIKKKKGAVLSGLVVVVTALCYLGVMLYAAVSEALNEVPALLILGVYGLVILAVLTGVVLALRQRLKELDRGEEEEAKRY